ncbi:Protein of unknown function [Pyronema omphalodes CBS 100304]|uniref:Uncharacterized protein n=1 Tax=Pyronema omphalodes (strain CBS 100304) TaxID=1076935 RepID=U4LFG7_PYROM|nr:Protein of unknown function [Pyronema omphalodes CBS 100304]
MKSRISKFQKSSSTICHLLTKYLESEEAST